MNARLTIMLLLALIGLQSAHGIGEVVFNSDASHENMRQHASGALSQQRLATNETASHGTKHAIHDVAAESAPHESGHPCEHDCQHCSLCHSHLSLITGMYPASHTARSPLPQRSLYRPRIVNQASPPLLRPPIS